MIEVKEILRLWLEGRSLRAMTTLAGVDRKTVRRYVDAAEAAGLTQECGPGQLTVTVLSQKIQQPAESSRVVGDTGARDDPGLVIDDGHVVLSF